MSSPVLVIARQELRMARTNRLAMILVGIFVCMVLVSGLIGWEAHHTVTSVYEEALREGATTQPNPFAGQQPLGLIQNTVIYVILIGALAAILLGVQSTMGDRKAGVIDLLFSRPLTNRQYVTGKLLGIQCLTGCVLAIACLFSWAVILLIRGQALSLVDTAALGEFFLLAWLFLFSFTVLGFVFGGVSRRETGALLVPILVWALLVFVVPQLGTAEHPVSLLNPVPAQAVSQGPFFAFNRHVLQPVSVTDRFKEASAGLLNADDVSWQAYIYDLLSLGVIALISLGATRVVGRETLRRPFRE